MDSCTLDMFHDSREETRDAIGDTVHFQLPADNIPVNQNRSLRRNINGIGHVVDQLILGVNDFHRASAEHIGWPDKTRIANLICNGHSGFRRGHGAAFRFWDVQFAEEGFKLMAIFSEIDGIRR